MYEKQMSTEIKLILVAGTRPEALKLKPLALALKDNSLASLQLWWTGQQICPPSETTDLNWKLSEPLNHPLPRRQLQRVIYKQLLQKLIHVLPHAVVVQGDTITAWATTLAAYDLRIPVVHLEAGLRSKNLRAPFPEETIRRAITKKASLHLTPCEAAFNHLQQEGVPLSQIAHVGSTAVDGISSIISRGRLKRVSPQFDVIVDMHRRENQGRVLKYLASALFVLSQRGLRIARVIHPNPLWEVHWKEVIPSHQAITTIAPLTQEKWLELVCSTRLLISDSGGVAEELPYLGIPLAVLRQSTERLEPIHTGHALLISPTSQSTIELAIEHALQRQQLPPWPLDLSSPYGDGQAGIRAARTILDWIRKNS